MQIALQAYTHHSGFEMSAVSCFTCLAGGGTGHIRIDDMIPPEVFVSGLSVLDSNMQSIVIDWLRFVELEADVRCCYRLGAGSEFADAGFKRAMFVLILLSDANPPPAHKARTVWDVSQRLIHILMPQWTGQRGQYYWEQCSKRLNSSDSRLTTMHTSITEPTIDLTQIRQFPSVHDIKN
jgi:hypothetical protein